MASFIVKMLRDGVVESHVIRSTDRYGAYKKASKRFTGTELQGIYDMSGRRLSLG